MTAHYLQNIDPIFALMVAIVQRALGDLRSLDSKVRERTIEWFTSEQKDYIFSYLAIKEFLGIEISGIEIVEQVLKERKTKPCAAPSCAEIRNGSC